MQFDMFLFKGVRSTSNWGFLSKVPSWWPKTLSFISPSAYVTNPETGKKHKYHNSRTLTRVLLSYVDMRVSDK